nr:phospholipase-like protein [Tanacetum cinerariifolium]
MVQTIRNCQLGSSDTVNTKGTHSKIEPKHEKTTLSESGEPPMPFKSVTRVNGKRKRYNPPWKRWPKSAEHGENLVGSRVRVWWPADRDYYEGVILYDDGDEDVLDLRLRKWMRYQDASDTPESAGQEVPQNVSSPRSSVVSVHGYNVKESVAPILESIFKKHGDIAANCSFKTESIRASFLELVCDVVKQIQTTELIATMEEIECKVSEAEAANINVSWLRSHLDDVKKNNPVCLWK